MSERRDFLKKLAILPIAFKLKDIATEPKAEAKSLEDIEELKDIYIFGMNIKVVHFSSKIDGSLHSIIQDSNGNRYRIEKLR